MEGKIQSTKGTYFFVKVEGQDEDIYCLTSQVIPTSDRSKMLEGAVVSIDDTEETDKSPRATGHIKLVTEAPKNAKSAKKEESKELSVDMKFALTGEKLGPGEEELEVTVNVKQGNKPASGLKVTLHADGEEVKSPAKELYTLQNGSVVFYVGALDASKHVQLAATVYGSKEEKVFLTRWNREKKEAGSVELKAKQTGHKDGVYTFEVSYEANEKFSFDSTAEISWKLHGTTEWQDQSADAPQFDDKGVAVVDVKAESGMGAAVTFTSGKSRSKDYWLYSPIKTEAKPATVVAPAETERKSFSEEVSGRRKRSWGGFTFNKNT